MKRNYASDPNLRPSMTFEQLAPRQIAPMDRDVAMVTPREVSMVTPREVAMAANRNEPTHENYMVDEKQLQRCYIGVT